MKTILAIALLATASDSAQRVDVMPTAFVGTWETSLASCEVRSATTLTIEPTFMHLPDGRGDFLAVVAKGNREVVLIAEWSGEVPTRLTSHQFIVDGDVLVQTDGRLDGKFIRRHRCPWRPVGTR